MRMAYEEGLGYWYRVAGATTASTLQKLTTRINALVAITPGTVSSVLYAATGYVPPVYSPPPSPPAPVRESHDGSINLAAAIATPIGERVGRWVGACV